MDRIRLGRALGFGARQAVKTLVTAVDAATAENPGGRSTNAGANGGQPTPQRRATDMGPGQTTGQAAPRTVPDAARKAIYSAARTVDQARGVEQDLRRGSRRFGDAVWGRFKLLSGVLWLEVSGFFFGLFASFALGAVLRLRGDWRLTATNAVGHRNLLVATIMLVLFGYFCVSNFVRARRRERGR
jgi:hypothetical protein